MRFGLGLGTGPGAYQGISSWWYEAFAAAHVPLSTSWELQLEPGVMKTSSSYPLGDPTQRSGGHKDGILIFRDRTVANAQQFDGTLVVLRTLLGYRFGSEFAMRFGPFAGYNVGATKTTVCGEETSRTAAAGGSLIPTLMLGQGGVELGVQIDMTYAPVALCTTADYWTEQTTFVHYQDTHGSIMLRTAYVNF